jgi:hypothetical protein
MSTLPVRFDQMQEEILYALIALSSPPPRRLACHESRCIILVHTARPFQGS